MAQAGILGRLQYWEAEHGWALDIGAQLSRFDLLSGTLTEADVSGIESSRRALVEDLNRTLDRQKIRYNVPEIVPGGNQIKSIIEELLQIMRYKCNSAQIACLFIGMANYFLGIANAIEGDRAEELRGLALNRLSALDLECGDLQIDHTVLLDRMNQTECDGQSIRQLLRNTARPMIILLISADPKNEPRLRLAEEYRVLDRALQASRIQDAYKLETLLSCRPQDIGRAIKRYRPTILHFSGHRSSTGVCVEDRNGQVQTIDMELLSLVLRLAKSLGVKGVVMNACYNKVQASLIALAVGSVIVVEGPVSDRGAIEFTRAFYECLGDGFSFSGAYEWALGEVGLSNATNPLRPYLIVEPDELPPNQRSSSYLPYIEIPSAQQDNPPSMSAGNTTPLLSQSSEEQESSELLRPNQSFQELRNGKKDKDSFRKETHPVHLIPFPRNPDFINPGTIFDELRDKCSKPASSVAIVGFAGIGKSEIALEHCYRTIERSPKTSIFWIAANDAVEINQGFRDIARSINIEGWQEPEADIFRLVWNWLCYRTDSWMVVLDNLDDVSGLDELPCATWSDSKSMGHILPYCRHGSVIITTRNEEAALTVVEQRDIVTTEQISEEYVLALINARLKTDESFREDAVLMIRMLQNPSQMIEFLKHPKKGGATTRAADSFESSREMEARNTHLLGKEKLKATDSDYSIKSIGSSTTLVPTFSYSTIVARSATVELEKFFQEDQELVDIYRLALKDKSTEPEKFKRSVTRMLQFFAKDLRREASGQLERVASCFVQSKAQYIAESIVERFHDTSKNMPQQQILSHDEEDEYRPAQNQLNNEQVELDEVEEEAPTEEDYFEDLAILRTFLVHSSAFQIFRARLSKFVLPKDFCPLDVDSTKGLSNDIPLLNIRHLLSSVSHIFKTVVIMFGCLEPPLQPGFIRLRWQCSIEQDADCPKECGASLFGDVQEYRIGGVSRLMQQMEKFTSRKVTATYYNKESSNQQYIPGPILWVREMTRNMTKAFSRDKKCNDTLPQHNDPSIKVSSASPGVESPPARDLLLLACMHGSQGGQLLRQDSISAMSNDRQLFCFIREQISRAPSKKWPSRLIRTVTGIHFTQFHLRLNDDVEPRLHKLCCRQDACQCIPLTSNAEYDCTPAGPLDFGPPVLPSKMLHYLKHPDLISEKEISILNQLPKRNCGKLQSTGQAPVEGWGLYYEENWNVGLVIMIFVVMTICASLLFGVWWTLARADIQGAWGVSSYMIAACALVTGLVGIVGRASGG